MTELPAAVATGSAVGVSLDPQYQRPDSVPSGFRILEGVWVLGCGIPDGMDR